MRWTDDGAGVLIRRHGHVLRIAVADGSAVRLPQLDRADSIGPGGRFVTVRGERVGLWDRAGHLLARYGLGSDQVPYVAWSPAGDRVLVRKGEDYAGSTRWRAATSCTGGARGTTSPRRPSLRTAARSSSTTVRNCCTWTSPRARPRRCSAPASTSTPRKRRGARPGGSPPTPVSGSSSSVTRMSRCGCPATRGGHSSGRRTVRRSPTSCSGTGTAAGTRRRASARSPRAVRRAWCSLPPTGWRTRRGRRQPIGGPRSHRPGGAARALAEAHPARSDPGAGHGR